MSDKTYTTVKSYADTNVNTNNANDITGAEVNTVLGYLLEGLAGKGFDATKPYKQYQTLTVFDATFGAELWIAPTDVAAAAFVAGSFTRLSKRSEEITASDTPYTGIELGTKTYSHNVGHVNFTIQAFESSGASIPLYVTAKSTTKITISSSVAYANAIIYIQEIIIS